MNIKINGSQLMKNPKIHIALKAEMDKLGVKMETKILILK